MKAFSSLGAVLALWLGVSFALWLLYRLFRSHDGSRRKALVDDALALVDEGAEILAALRRRSPASRRVAPFETEEDVREDVRRLLNGIEANSAYFERVNAAKKKLQTAFDVADFAPLAEVLQIRRDFWAASEIFLIEDIRLLGPELADEHALETFRDEAHALLFRDPEAEWNPKVADTDPVALRLSLARQEAEAFAGHVAGIIAAEREQGGIPRPAEIAAVPLSLLRAVGTVWREGRSIAVDAAATARRFARSVGEKGFTAAAEELRRARTDLPGQFASAFERAGGLARKGGEGLKRHYEFVLEAQELRARYAELLARAPHVSEKGRQFLARLELERRAEQFRETSGGASDWLRQRVVIGIALLIRGLQYVQAKVTPQKNKQLAVRPSAGEPAPTRTEAAADEPAPEPLRALLMPASAYAGGNRGRAQKTSKRKAADAEPPRGKKRGGSLLDRLEGVGAEQDGAADASGGQAAKSQPEAKPAKKKGHHLFG
ncbi:hypothetical protein T281_03990 [Rhodomicrobium udaipurense JA643]|uniref:Uncharacterized protein n=1 Tax=Rhodomicrobium udaipurense TaxID=1202716 RepID=A0A8I1GJ52_9HYPH|nr:hypothetical protein [Rhodomicrobium udaipurense]KAI95737.1 hypothetical protein T281_03990 [Rhodomicrobium udaipurense JA643]MBJ7544925.1 hypothetical protein [Rhodomicrobium udaipurense]